MVIVLLQNILGVDVPAIQPFASMANHAAYNTPNNQQLHAIVQQLQQAMLNRMAQNDIIHKKLT